MLMISPSISHYHLEGTEEEMRKLQGAYTVEMASLDVESDSCGRRVVWLVKFAWIRACVKAGLPYHLNIPSLTLPVGSCIK